MFAVKPRSASRDAFTLVEILVVLLIIAVLLALLFPAVSGLRESANDTSCKNNLRQIGQAIMSYQTSNNGRYPASWNSTPAGVGSSDISGWSAQALLTSHLEQTKLFDKIDFTQPYSTGIEITTADGTVTALGAMRVATYLCPSEVRDEVRLDSSTGDPEHYPLNYAFNLGTWFVYDPETREGGDGAFFPDSRLSSSNIRDGVNETLCAAEVKGWTPYYRNAANDSVPPIPNPLDLDALCSLGGTFKTNSGHTEWIDGRAHQTGFTTTFTPNAKTLCDESGTTYDVDWTNWQEGKGAAAATPSTTPTYAAVTSRSYHPGGVNVVMLGGSVHRVADDIDPFVWRAYSTRNGGEIFDNKDQLTNHGS
ncbi:MAG: DUF1559 domain-containing protein [Planctomycetota bacterium]|nr:MAG: DUF1559 domain-containing protein [Planctomycetota bacterium]REK46950.1 MAG: DUF1559 domain-containing protein [Planctomycetota bacterium]